MSFLHNFMNLYKQVHHKKVHPSQVKYVMMLLRK